MRLYSIIWTSIHFDDEFYWHETADTAIEAESIALEMAQRMDPDVTANQITATWQRDWSLSERGADGE